MSIALKDFGHIIDCSADPYDLRPAAAGILKALENIRAKDKDKPVVILMGEHHAAPSHLFLTQLLSSQIEKPFATGLEMEHSMFGQALASLFDPFGHECYGPDFCEAFKLTDPDGRRALNYCIAYSNAKQAPVSSANHFSFCMRNGSIGLNDLETNGVFLDPSFPFLNKIKTDAGRAAPLFSRLARVFFQKAKYHVNHSHSWPDEISAADGLGVALRNKAIAERILRHISRTEVTSYIQRIGAMHVFGSEATETLRHVSPGSGGKYSYAHSMVNILEQKNVTVLPVWIPTSLHEKMKIPDDARNTLNQSVLVQGLAEELFSDAPVEEAIFIQKLRIHSRSSFEIFDRENERRLAAQKVLKFGRLWIDEAKTAMQSEAVLKEGRDGPLKNPDLSCP